MAAPTIKMSDERKEALDQYYTVRDTLSHVKWGGYGPSEEFVNALHCKERQLDMSASLNEIRKSLYTMLEMQQAVRARNLYIRGLTPAEWADYNIRDELNNLMMCIERGEGANEAWGAINRKFAQIKAKW